jgi:YebC/PmpR family DNA-binding regulatory protein
MNYEGYRSGGVAVLVECLSDNRNRTASEIRMIFDRNSGNLASSGAVTWMFHRKARFIITGEQADEEILLELLIDDGVESIEVEDGIAEVTAPPEAFEKILVRLEEAGIKTEESSLAQMAENTVCIKDAHTAVQVLRLIDKLEEQEDVQAVYSNVDIPPEIMDAVAQENL